MAKQTKNKSIKAKELSSKSLIELKKILKKFQAEWFKLKMDQKINKLKNVHAAKTKRKEIARIKTIMRKKELEETLK